MFDSMKIKMKNTKKEKQRNVWQRENVNENNENRNPTEKENEKDNKKRKPKSTWKNEKTNGKKTMYINENGKIWKKY